MPKAYIIYVQNYCMLFVYADLIYIILFANDIMLSEKRNGGTSYV